jgi:microcystin-dependent protein
MTRDGFIIRNASAVAPNLLMSQPDQGDFQILGNNRYGVVKGCAVTLGGSTVSITGSTTDNVVVVDGEVFTPSAWSDTIVNGSNVGPRFDLVVYSSVDGFSVILGTASVNAVYPEIPSTATVLAAVYVPASTSGTFIITDKRNFLQASVVGKDQDVIVENYGAEAPTLTIEGSGKISLGNGTDIQDAFIERTAAGTLTVSDELIADTLTATSSATVNGKDVVTTETIQWGAGAAPNVSTVDVGDIYVNTINGSISVAAYDSHGDKFWNNIASSGNPSGTVIMSFMTKEQATEYMPGWLALDGSVVATIDAGVLGDRFPEWKIGDGDTLRLPDMTQRFPIGASTTGTVGTYNGSVIGESFGTASATLTINNLPSHRHVDANQTSTGTSGLHSHSAHVTGNGSHSHDLSGNGANHTHFSAEAPAIITSNYNTVSHAGNVPEGYIPQWNDTISQNNIWVRTSPSARTSIPEPPLTIQSSSHSHTVTVDQVSSGHTHTLPTHNSVGKLVPDPVTITPPSLSLLFYIKI